MPRILYIGFGMDPFMRGGAITYQESLFEALHMHGWDVVCYLSAPRYTYQDTPRLRKRLYKGIKVLELVDPPYHYGHRPAPLQQCNHPHVERLSKDVLEKIGPDLVHIHELQFHPASIMDIIANKRIPVLKTMHNYYDLCPEGNLMYRGEELCTDYDDGGRCVACLANRPAFFTNFKIRLGQALPSGMRDLLLRSYLNLTRRMEAGKPENNNSAKIIAPCRAGEYRYRRDFFVERLNRLDAIHCSASRAADIFSDYGIAKEKIKVIPISVKKQESIKLKKSYNHSCPVVFGFIGGGNFHKGYHVLVDAFSRLDQRKARLIIWGDCKADVACRNLNVEYRKSYSDGEINEVLGEVDVFVVPSVWEEIFGIVGIECRTAGIPVIGSNIGGIPEWLNNGETGFLITPNNPQELAAAMGRFVNNPHLISMMQQHIKPWKSFDEHVNEMLELYREVMQKKASNR